MTDPDDRADELASGRVNAPGDVEPAPSDAGESREFGEAVLAALPVWSRSPAGLVCDGVPLAEVAAAVGTPCYVYSGQAVDAAYSRYAAALTGPDDRVCYAVKANGALAILARLAGLGAGFDVVSVGELERVLAAGGRAESVVFSGVGKSAAELATAIERGIGCINVESEPELRRLEAIARARGAVAPVAVRVNPDVDARTHPYISTGLQENKFGVPTTQARSLYQQAQASPALRPVGIACHIGSQLTKPDPWLDAAEHMVTLAEELASAGIRLQHLDLGGGFAVRYCDETAAEPALWLRALRQRLGERLDALGCALWVEPGRAIVANAGILVTRIEYLKENGGRHFCIVDAGMNDLLRPALYQAWHAIVPVHVRRDTPLRRYQVVGPVCETGDFLGHDRWLAVDAGDLLAVLGAGAYAAVMASNYNARLHAPEVLIDRGAFRVTRPRRPLSDLWAHERV